MRLPLFCLLALTAVCQAAAPPLQVWDGKPISSSTQILHLAGKAVSVRTITIASHPMGCQLIKNGCPLNYQLSFVMQAGTQEANCGRWFTSILSQEQANQAATPYPFFELVTQPGQVFTDESIWILPAGTVACYGALDWTGSTRFIP
jgi:hypothetical protein